MSDCSVLYISLKFCLLLVNAIFNSQLHKCPVYLDLIRYHDTTQFLSGVDVVNTLGLVRVLGLEGAVVWGDSKDMNTWTKCNQLKVGQLSACRHLFSNVS